MKNNNKDLVLAVISTFVIGVVAGAYLYLTDFAALVAKFDVPDAEQVSEFRVVGDMQGGCSMVGSCPSFQLLGNGEYRYLSASDVDVDQPLKAGVLPLKLRRELMNVLVTKDLVRQSQPVESSSCDSFVDGIDYNYDVTIDGNEYTLNSCHTAIEDDSELWVSLDSLWEYFDQAGNN